MSPTPTTVTIKGFFSTVKSNVIDINSIQESTIYTALKMENTYTLATTTDMTSLETSIYNPTTTASTSFGLKVDSCGQCRVGATSIFNSLTSDAGSILASSSISLTQNGPTDRGAGFTYVSDYKFYNKDSLLDWPLSSQSSEPCLFFKYIYYKTDTSIAMNNKFE